MYRLLDNPRSSSDLGPWQAIAGEFTDVVGWTSCGEFFLRNPANGYYAFLAVGRPGLVPLRYDDSRAFVADFLPRASSVRVPELERRLGALAAEDVFTPTPDLHPATLSPEAYHTENVWQWGARTAAHYGVGGGDVADTVLRELRPSDDFDLWRVALDHILAELSAAPGTLVEVGRCSHWLRPHQSRWTLDGGFAWPEGYGTGEGAPSFVSLPQFDWSVTLARVDGHWEVARAKRTQLAVRIAIPSRTRRHPQAAVHTLWATGREKEIRFYGFRRSGDAWRCTAETEWADDRRAKVDQRRKERVRGRCRLTSGG